MCKDAWSTLASTCQTQIALLPSATIKNISRYYQGPLGVEAEMENLSQLSFASMEGKK